MDKLISDINNYTEYLKTVHKLSVSMHFEAPELLSCERLITANTYHDNRYCLMIKLKRLDICRRIKGHICRNLGNQAFFGQCWAGVCEYVFPAVYRNKTIAFISITGFGKGRLNKRRLRLLAQRCGYDEKQLSQTYALLPPPAEIEHLNAVLAPAVRLLELLYIRILQEGSFKVNINPVFQKVYNFILENYKNDINLQDISRACNYSQSHISHVFKDVMNCSAGSFITALKVAEAERLLGGTAENIAEIAAQLGFNDPDYFSAVFKKANGKSPTKYRAELKK